MSNGGDCKTAPATPGLLKILLSAMGVSPTPHSWRCLVATLTVSSAVTMVKQSTEITRLCDQTFFKVSNRNWFSENIFVYFTAVVEYYDYACCAFFGVLPSRVGPMSSEQDILDKIRSTVGPRPAFHHRGDVSCKKQEQILLTKNTKYLDVPSGHHNL